MMPDNAEQSSISQLTGRMIGQPLDHFDPFQGLLDNEERASHLRNLRYGFRIRDYRFLIEQKTDCEVVQEKPIYEVPNTAAWVLGIINLRGNLVPVFDLMKRLDPTCARPDAARLLVFDRGEQAVAIYIDGLPVGLEIDPDNQPREASVPEEIPELLRRHIGPVYQTGDHPWMELHHRSLFEELLSDAGMAADGAGSAAGSEPRADS